MIVIKNASHQIVKGKVRKDLLEDCNFVFDLPRVGIVAHDINASECILDLLAGYIRPDKGIVRRFGRISWPLGRTVQFRSDLNGRITLHFFCQLYKLDYRKCERFMRDIVDFSHYFDESILEWPKGLIVEFSYAAYLLPDFDIYLAETALSAGDTEFMTRWLPPFQKRLEKAMFIMTGSDANRLSPYVEKTVAIDNGQMILFDDMSAAFELSSPSVEASSHSAQGRAMPDLMDENANF